MVRSILPIILLVIAFSTFVPTVRGGDRLSGTLVVAVPVVDGLVACADKRLFNVDANTFKDETVKIRQVGDNALFVATNTVGFYDRNKKAIAFDAFKITAEYAAKNDIADERSFFEGLRKEIEVQLRSYLAARPFAEWPETDRANRGLLFNLVFYTVEKDAVRSHTVKVFYEKAPNARITIPAQLTQAVKFPKLSGKGRDVMAYLAAHPAIAAEPSILRFDEANFDPANTTVADAVSFSRKLFLITSAAIPQARVSSTFDCAYLSRAAGFQWLDGFGRSRSPAAVR